MQGLKFKVPIYASEAKEAEVLIETFKSPLSHVPFKNETAHSELGLQTPVFWFKEGVGREKNCEPSAVSWVGTVVNPNSNHLSLPCALEKLRICLYKPRARKCLQDEVESIIWLVAVFYF